MIYCLTADCSPLLDPARLDRALAALPDWRRKQILARSGLEHRAAGAAAWLLVQKGAEALGISLPFSPPAHTLHGKPYFPQLPQFSFSLSHSKSRCLCLVSDDGQRLGCDVEQLRPLPHWEKLAKRFFHPREVDWLSRQQQPETAFFRLWCEKEAALKATGAGFSQGMKWFSLRGEAPEEVPPVRMGGVLEGYAYGLCLEQAKRGIPLEEVKLVEYPAI